MSKKTVAEWAEELKKRFDFRELQYMSVKKARLRLQLKDEETGEIHLHELEYAAKDAENLQIIK